MAVAMYALGTRDPSMMLVPVILFALFIVPLQIFTTGMNFFVFDDHRATGHATIADAFRKMKPRFWHLFILHVVLALLSIGFFLIAGVVMAMNRAAGLITMMLTVLAWGAVMLRWAIALPLVTVGDRNPFDALRESGAFVGGHFLKFLLAAFGLVLISLVLSLGATLLGLIPLVGVFAQAAFSALTMSIWCAFQYAGYALLFPRPTRDLGEICEVFG